MKNKIEDILCKVNKNILIEFCQKFNDEQVVLLNNEINKISKKYNKKMIFGYIQYSEIEAVKQKYRDKTSSLSASLKEIIEKTIGTEISYKTYYEVMKSCGFDELFITKEMRKKIKAEEEKNNAVLFYDEYMQMTEEDLKNEIKDLPSKRYFLGLDKAVVELRLKKANQALRNKNNNSLILDKENEINKFKQDIEKKSTDELREMVFDDSDEITENEKKLIRILLRKRYEVKKVN